MTIDQLYQHYKSYCFASNMIPLSFDEFVKRLGI